MDLNPDEALAAAWLRSGSFVARVLERMSRFSLHQASTVIVLDHFMRDRIVAKGIPAEKVEILPLWSQGVRFDGAGRDCFRAANGLEGKFVVMYAGNHSPCHPLSTLVDAARALESDPGIVFCFVGGGSEFPKVQRSAEGLKNVLYVGYQPRAQLAAMLSAADLLVATMGTPFVGMVHPCKVYNMLSVGTPILYLGPKPSHITELLESESQVTRDWAHNAPWFTCAEHGQTDLVVKEILLARAARKNLTRNHEYPGAVNFSPDRILPKLIDQFESAADLERSTKGTGSVISRECHRNQRLERRANVSP
jgi:hypothetical protein